MLIKSKIIKFFKETFYRINYFQQVLVIKVNNKYSLQIKI